MVPAPVFRPGKALTTDASVSQETQVPRGPRTSLNDRPACAAVRMRDRTTTPHLATKGSKITNRRNAMYDKVL